MPKIKIVWTEQYTDDWDTKVIMRGVPETDFEDISEEDLQRLRRNLYRIPKPSHNFTPCIVMLDEVPVATRLETINEILKKIEVDAQLQREKQAKARLKAKATREQKERDRFEALKAKFEGK